jgi:hypothetical protein
MQSLGPADGNLVGMVTEGNANCLALRGIVEHRGRPVGIHVVNRFRSQVRTFQAAVIAPAACVPSGCGAVM